MSRLGKDVDYMIDIRCEGYRLGEPFETLYFAEAIVAIIPLIILGYYMYIILQDIIITGRITISQIVTIVLIISAFLLMHWLYFYLFYAPSKFKKEDFKYLKERFLADIENRKGSSWSVRRITWAGVEREIKYEFTLCPIGKITRECYGFVFLTITIPAGAWDKVYEDILPKVRNKEFKVEDLYDVKYIYVDGEKILLKDTEYWTLMFILTFEDQLKRNKDFTRVRQIIRSPNRYYRKGEGY